MYLAIIVLPILGSIVSGFFGRKVGVSGAQLITCLCVIITTVLAIIGFFEAGLNNTPVSISLFKWVDSESLNVLWGFNFDSLTACMLIPVLIVSCLVHIYSIGYMSHDPHNQRFFSYLSLFTFMMIVLVTANNFLLMFVGWEGVGICSYLLVSFWFTRIAANQSSISAFLTNRVGDCFLTLGMFAMIWTFGNLDYSTVFSLAPHVNGNVVTIVGICLLIGAMAKSSQIGLHVWLPLAMEGPTPVSALIHAATMVTAGVYLLMRVSPLIEYSSTVLILCLWIGSITTVFSSLIGLFQQDIKKVIAYSTMSQLGMMVIAVGLSSYNIALFHLVNHAFYKGLLFLGAGAVIHAVADNQDFRKYGGLIGFLPLTYSVMLIASLSLVAFPFMTGFYSKDFILESAYGQFHFYSVAVYFIATMGAMFTTLYSVKVLYLTFLTNANGPLVNYKKAHEGDIYMSLPLIILAVFSIFFGYITKDMFIGLASGFYADNSLFIHPLHEIMLETEFAVPNIFKLLPLLLTVLLSALSLILSEYLSNLLIKFKFTRLGYNTFSFFNQRFLIELFYNKYITRFILNLGGQTTKVLDKGSVELLGPYGLEKGLLKLSKGLSSLDTGVITSYALYILIGLILYILIPYISIKDITLLLLIMFTLLVITIDMSSPKPSTFDILPLQSGFIDLGMLLCDSSQDIKNSIPTLCGLLNIESSCIADPLDASLGQRVSLLDPNSLESKVDSFLSTNKASDIHTYIHHGIPSIDSLLQFESDMAWNKCSDYISQKFVSPRISSIEMSWLSKPLDNSMYLHNPELDSVDYVMPTLDLTSPTPAYSLSYTKNLIAGINVSTLLNENNKVILASILGAFIVKLNRYSIASNSKTKSYKAPWGFYMSYLDLVVANAKSAMGNLVIYMNTGSSSVSEGKKPVKVSESVPLSKQAKAKQDKLITIAEYGKDLDENSYILKLSASIRENLTPYMVQHMRENPIIEMKDEEEAVCYWTIIRNIKHKAIVEYKTLGSLLYQSNTELSEKIKAEVIMRRGYLEVIKDDTSKDCNTAYRNLSTAQRKYVMDVYKKLNIK